MTSSTADETECHNCVSPLGGPFCARCGQKAAPLNPTVHDFLHDLAREMLHVDGRIFQSVRLLLLSPGRLTRELFEGRRASICVSIAIARAVIAGRYWRSGTSGGRS